MDPIIYCILLTGKNDERYKFIPIAIKNFNNQTYPNKKLLIINHGNKKQILKEIDNIEEIMFDKSNFTLGCMRNFAIDMIPYNTIWTVWDDDDIRHEKYLEILYKNLIKNNADVLFYKNRIDYNINNKFGYRCKFDNGMPCLLAKKTEVIQYLKKDSLEDIKLQTDFSFHNKKIFLLNNDPRLYIRIIHDFNTSLFVDNSRKSIVNYSDNSHYHEFELTDKEREYVKKTISEYFK